MTAARPAGIDLARIAHDLRGPLMPLRTAAWLLRNEQGEPARVCELADLVERQSVRLARMLDELSDWGRVADTPAGLRLEPVDVALAVDMAMGGLSGCQVEPDITKEAAAFPLQVDSHRFGQVLLALVEHALHRDPDAQPEVTLYVASRQLHVRVRDHGPALDAAEREALLVQPQARPFDDGLGLRLLLARRIAEAHGGRLDIDDATLDGLALVCALPSAQPGNGIEPSRDALAGGP